MMQLFFMMQEQNPTHAVYPSGAAFGGGFFCGIGQNRRKP